MKKPPDPERCFLAGVLVAEAHGIASGVSQRLEHRLDGRAKERIGSDLDRSRHLLKDAVVTHGAACRLELARFKAETITVQKALAGNLLDKAKEKAVAAMITALDCLGNLHEACAPRWQKICQRGEYGWNGKKRRTS